MTREIKFRGFQKSWIYGGISIFQNEAIIFDINCVANSAYEVDINSVGQFTGLIDKNNVEIYEHDILELPNGTQVVVEWSECGFILILKNETIWQNLLWNVINHYTVVGNIHEHQ